MSERARPVHAIDGAGRWLSAGAVGLCLLLLAGLLALLVQQASSAFAVLPVEVLSLRGDPGDSLLGELVEVAGDRLVIRGSEWRRQGDAYRRIAVADLTTRDRPQDILLIRLRDGRHWFVREAVYRSVERDEPIVWSGMPAGIVLHHSDIAEVIAPNRLDWVERCRTLLSRAWLFLQGGRAQAVAGGDGLLAALIGSALLVILMSILVMPLGVLTALWMHEYAGSGWRARLIRASVSNLAAVPSVIYGLFGLALFVHTLGGSLDRWFYAERLPAPTFGAGGLLWSALTLALLTLPVVIVATEEGLSRVPRSLRMGALALGATRSEMLWNVVLPVARPALLTGLILAVSRAAGEVAPLMLVGVVKLAAALPVDAEFPWLHPSRAFMHLGHVVYDQALSGNDAVRAGGRAYAAALLLLALVVILNAIAILVRNRLRERSRQFQDD
ncbi:MAG: phosphate ABC transporter permease PstA [Tahibacter sp.]